MTKSETRKRLDWERRRAIIKRWHASGGSYKELAEQIGMIGVERARQLVRRWRIEQNPPKVGRDNLAAR